MEPIAGTCEVFYGWVENSALSCSLISQRALQCEGPSALTGTWDLYGLSSLGWEKGAGVHTMWRIRMAGDPAGFTLWAEPKESVFCTSTRWGWKGRWGKWWQQGRESHVPTSRWGAEARPINPAGSGLPLPDPSEALTCPPCQGRLGFCKEDWDKGVHCLAQKGLFNENLRIFAYIKVPGLGICQVSRTARQHLNIQWHLERGRGIHRRIKIKWQGKKKDDEKGKSQPDQSRKQASGRSSYWSSC